MAEDSSSTSTEKSPQPTSGSAKFRDSPQATPASGRRQAFRDLRRQLSEDELSSAGVQKLLLDELEKAETECELAEAYISRYYEADKRAAVLEERVRTATALEVAFGVGVGVGGAILGLAPAFWDTPMQGWIVLVIGLALIVGAIAARVVKK